MVPHMVYFVILVTIQRYFINVQYCDVKSRKYGPHRGRYTNIVKTAIGTLYFQCYNPISYSGHPRGSQNIGVGGARESYIYLASGLIK